MKTLALFYNEAQRLEVTDTLEDLKEFVPSISIVLIDDAYEINKYLMRHSVEIDNPGFFAAELIQYRKDEKLGLKIDKAIEEESVTKLRNYLEDEVLDRFLNLE